MGSTERAAKLQLMTDSSFQDLQRFAMLAKAGVETPIRVEGYRRVFIQNESDSETAARVASLTVIDREAAEKGYFLGENVGTFPTRSSVWMRSSYDHSNWHYVRRCSKLNARRLLNVSRASGRGRRSSGG